MIKREDILSMEYLKKTEYTACHQGMRYRLEKLEDAEGKKTLRCTVWPEPFNFFTTPADEKQSAEFTAGCLVRCRHGQEMSDGQGEVRG